MTSRHGVFIEHLGIPVSIPAYLAGIRMAKRHPDRTFRYTLRHWSPGTGEKIMAEYRRDLHDRINRRGGMAPADSRLGPAQWGYVCVPRLVLPRDVKRGLNRHHKRHLGRRAELEE
jgi:hypothetical protein